VDVAFSVPCKLVSNILTIIAFVLTPTSGHH
jgi:hypothetical protein